MAVNRFYSITLTFFVVVLGYLSYQILKPFLSPIAWAIVLSMVFYPLYVFILKYLKWSSLASFATLCIIILIILGPFSYMLFLLVKELKNISDYVEGGSFDALQKSLKHPALKTVIDNMTSWFNVTEQELDRAIVNNISKLGKGMLERATTGVGDVVDVAVNFIFMAFATFFILRDGSGFLQKIRDYMPFADEHKDRLAKQIRDIIISTVYGGVAVAIVQGIIAGISFSILGVPSPVVWGLATAIASFIPLLGAAAVWVPAMVYLFMKGMVVKGIVLLFIGVFGISLIDNILKPIIIGGRTKMPVLAIFFSVLGGIKLFGIIGLILGPLVLAIFVSVVEIFRNIEGGQNA